MNSDKWVPLTLEQEEDVVEEVINFEGGTRKIERWRANGQVADEQYFDADGKLHRENGPASISRYGSNGAVGHIYYYRHGEPHRSDGPAQQNWWSDGSLEWEVWYLDGKKHREGNHAAETIMAADGDYVSDEGHYLNGRLHRTDGPALIKRSLDRSGRSPRVIITEQKFYYNGLQQTGPTDDPTLDTIC